MLYCFFIELLHWFQGADSLLRIGVRYFEKLRLKFMYFYQY